MKVLPSESRRHLLLEVGEAVTLHGPIGRALRRVTRTLGRALGRGSSRSGEAVAKEASAGGKRSRPGILGINIGIGMNLMPKLSKE